MVDATGVGDVFWGVVISKIQKCGCKFTSGDMAEFVQYGELTAIPYVNELDSKEYIL